MDAINGGRASAVMRCASFKSVALRTARKAVRSRPFSARQPIKYNTPSIIPQARLHPSAPISIVRTSSRPASATLSAPVNVRTMIRPKRTSETRSIGSNTRLEDRSEEISGMGRWKLNLLRGLQFETVAKQPADNNEKDAGRCAERRQCHKQGP